MGFIGCQHVEDISGKSDVDLKLSGNWPLNLKYDKKVIETGNPITKVSQVLESIDGKPTSFVSKKLPIFDDNKNIMGVLSIFEKEVDHVLSDQIFFQHILDYLPYYIFWKDDSLRYLGCNDNFAKLIGRGSKENVIGFTDYDFDWGKGEADMFRKADMKIIQTKKKQINREEILKRDAEKEITMLVSKVPVCNEKQDVIGVLGISTDITKLKNTEKELILANRVKSEFIANMSHDLRTPMTGVLSMLEGLMLTVEDVEGRIQAKDSLSVEQYQIIFKEFLEKSRQYITAAKASSNELIDLFNEILETMRLESGTFELKLTSFNLLDLLDKNINLFQSVANHKQLNLSYTLEENIPLNFKGFSLYIDRCLSNLIGNALGSLINV